MPSLDEIRRVKESAEAGLLGRPGVTGVDVGYKVVGGKRTDELSIRVYVKKKMDVPPAESIPLTIEGVKTDVIERTFVLQPLHIPQEQVSRSRHARSYDPLKGGIS